MTAKKEIKCVDILREAQEYDVPDSDLGETYTLHRTKEQKRQQRIAFVYGNLPARMNLSMEDVKELLEEND
jgi:hypothetical protein